MLTSSRCLLGTMKMLRFCTCARLDRTRPEAPWRRVAHFGASAVRRAQARSASRESRLRASARLGQPWGYPKLQVKTRISLTNADQVWDIPKTKRIYLSNNTYGVQTCIWYIHGISCDNQRYPCQSYISRQWYRVYTRDILVYLKALVCTRDIPSICQNTKTYQRGQDSR